jgi:hypothetical protein
LVGAYCLIRSFKESFSSGFVGEEYTEGSCGSPFANFSIEVHITRDSVTVSAIVFVSEILTLQAHSTTLIVTPNITKDAFFQFIGVLPEIQLFPDIWLLVAAMIK